MFGGHELVVIRRTVFIVAFVPYNARKTSFDDLLCDITGNDQ